MNWRRIFRMSFIKAGTMLAGGHFWTGRYALGVMFLLVVFMIEIAPERESA